MLKGLLCIFKGHTFEFATHKDPWRSMTPPIMVINCDGSLDIKQPINIGFLHYGIISNCQSCGKEVDAEDMGLPILLPDFEND